MTHTTSELADIRLLELANEKGKFAIAIGLILDEALQEAFERGIDNDWFTLVDISQLAHGGDTVCRVFKLTDKGRGRLAWLKPWSRHA